MRGTPATRSSSARFIVAVACLSTVFWSLGTGVTPAASRVCVGAMDQTACVPPS